MTENKLLGPIVIAIDGGGTSCKASIYDSNSNQILASAITGPANVFSNFELAIDNIVTASNQLLQQLNSRTGTKIQLKDCFLSAGLAGANTQNAKKQLANWQHPFEDVFITTDVHIGCAGANSLENCFFIIVGTGSCFALFKDRSLTQFGGHGFLLGDQASGAWLGKKALSWYLKSLDLNVSKCELTNMLANRVGLEPSNIIQTYSASQISKIAQLAKEIINLRDTSKQVNKWLDEGTEYIFNMIMAHASSVETVCIAGGLSEVYKQKIQENFNLKLQKPQRTPMFGAYLLAKERFIKDIK